jgi:hypothetical protein
MFQQRTAEDSQVDGLDPVLGYGADVAIRRLGVRVAGDLPPLALGGFVTTTGAVYAFAPSLTALAMLAGERSLDAVAAASE